jgi:ligand-binding sensor domain-containing protein
MDYWREGKVVRYRASEGLGNLPIRAVLADRSGEVWAGTWGGGLLKLQDGRFERVPGSERLPPVVHSLLEDREGRIWVGTEGGLARQEDSRWRLYTVDDGLSASSVRALAEGRDGEMWVGTWGAEWISG